MTKKGLTFSVFIFLLLNNLLETAAQMFFKKAAISQEHFNISQGADILVFVGHMITCPFLWFAFLAVFFIFTNWSAILSKIDLSIAVPIASLSYVLVTLAALVFFHEQISTLRWIGILVILAGVSLVSTSSSKREA